MTRPFHSCDQSTPLVKMFGWNKTQMSTALPDELFHPINGSTPKEEGGQNLGGT
jgi:hypothetical protein